MKVNLNIGYDQLIDLINWLPPKDLIGLEAEIERTTNESSLAVERAIGKFG